MDYAATSPVKPEVLKAMMPYFNEKFGNPSSIHSFGRETRNAVEAAREIVAKFLNCSIGEVIFTSGGTESDNYVIKGVIEAYRISHIADRQNDKPLAISHKPHLITSAFEHHAVLDTCKDLEKRGLAEVSYLKPKSDGVIDVKDVETAIKSNTVLITIMYVNNEIGTVQPIREIGKLIEKINLKKQETRNNNQSKSKSQIPNNETMKQWNNRIFFHTDAVQAVEYFNCDTKYLHVDALSLSAHKFGGPKGVGVLYLKRGIPVHKQNIGGAQEYNKRAGTENVASIIGLAKAIQLLSEKLKVKSEKLMKLRNYFIDQVTKKIPNVSLNGSREKRSPNNINLSFKHVEGESILLNLDLLGIAASSGSACTSGSLEPSHVLTAMGLPPEVAHGSIRFTIGEKNTKEEVDFVVKSLEGVIKKLREISPYK